ncbi:hypothetical protein niasHT_019326 [Heterodera trifolii]|uniref:Uncharacterized protein n=1 Tax=Heterodera trifolii TaxID=157864 RepID=A0ABD2L5G6_9BILA
MRQSICKTFGERRGDKTTYGIEVFGMNMFKEMMEKRSGQQQTTAWEILNSFYDSLLPSERSAEFVIEKIDDDKFFNFGLNAREGGRFRHILDCSATAKCVFIYIFKYF